MITDLVDELQRINRFTRHSDQAWREKTTYQIQVWVDGVFQQALQYVPNKKSKRGLTHYFNVLLGNTIEIPNRENL